VVEKRGERRVGCSLERRRSGQEVIRRFDGKDKDC
jgi:hypothetical protein